MVVASRVKSALALLAVTSALGACASTRASAPPPRTVPPGATTNPSTPEVTAGTSTTSAPITTTTRCSNQTIIAGWSITHRAAQLVVAPVLNFNPDDIAVAVRDNAGGILFLGNAPPPQNLAAQLSAARARSAPGPAPFVMADQEGGGIQRLAGAVASLPWPRDLARTATPDQVKALTAQVGRQMKQLGVDVDLAPVLDVDGGPGPSATNPDGSRSFSADPAVAARYGVAFLQGLWTGGVLPVVKHFPGLGDSSGNTDVAAAHTLPLTTLRTAGLPPFEAAITAGAPAVMIANATVPGLTNLPAALSPEAINGLLRHDLGFGGLVLTDSLSAGAITQAGYDVPHAAVSAIGAGADMILFGSTLTPADAGQLASPNLDRSINQIVATIAGAVGSGTLPAGRLDSAVGHVLTAKGVDLCAH
jgi:beta-N-acetylhexosaminidase